MQIKIDDLLKQKEITKYITNKEKLLSLIKSKCEFLKVSEGVLEYNLPENMTVFSILNIPLKMTKDEVIKTIELINLQYNRLYKRGFYWVLSTVDKETVICMQNSLRDLNFDESKVKYDLNNRNQILKTMKEQAEKNLYQKEAKNLGVPKGNNKNNNNNFKPRGSDADSDAFSWRKGSCEGRTSFDVGDKQGYKKNNYYNKNNNQKKRNRFNSDNAGQKYNNNNYDNNYNNYNYNNNYNNNYYNNYNNNYHNNYRSNNTNEIEIDISNLKYPINIKYKYSFTDIKSFYQKITTNNLFPEKPKYLSDIFNEIISDKKKDIVVLDELIESSKALNQINNNEKKDQEEKVNTNIKIPKMNPLSSMGKGFKK